MKTHAAASRAEASLVVGAQSSATVDRNEALPSYLDGVLLFGRLFLLISLVIRASLLLKSANEVDWSFFNLAGAFLIGMFYDAVTACYLAIPMVLYLVICPARWFGRKWHKRLMLVAVFVILYVLWLYAVAEWLFWDEFRARFNFIAVDYLIYTTEVLGNIRESYPLPLIFGGLALAAALTFWFLLRFGGLASWMEDLRTESQANSRRARFVKLAPVLVAAAVFTVVVNGNQVPSFGNSYNQELARNGLYSFFSAYRNNELNYDQFYDTVPTDEAFARISELLAGTDSTFDAHSVPNLTRTITHDGPEKRWNVVQITVESLSAEFLGVYGNPKGLTPHLDALAEQSLFFTNFFATGTRTVRGMEALTLSIPPTPGQSIVRRPGNEHLFTLGSVFRSRGYDTAFIYGGFGYFDNMNYFFSRNGYRIIDRSSVPSTNITFANVWGACDEDTLNWSLKEADNAVAQGQPFFHFVMTTSNHRPFTYPEGRVDIPSHSGRDGGVKYTDYAIGAYLEKARTRSWFTNTLFVIVADHCAASAGRTDLPIKRYEIPLMIYNPGLVQPKRIGTLCSQIDYPPTLLALLNWSYESRFFGKDIMRMKSGDERAFIASYQKLGLLTDTELAVLKPVREHAVYTYERCTGDQTGLSGNDSLLRDCIAYYQTASYAFRNGLNREISER